MPGGEEKSALTNGALMITVLLVDDHSYIRKGIRYLLEATPGMEVVATASNGIEAVARARLLQPDIVIIGLSMPLMNGIEATKQICASCPQTRVLTLSIYDNPEYVQSAVQAGARGYVLKDKIPDELLVAIRSLHQGKRFFSRQIAGENLIRISRRITIAGRVEQMSPAGKRSLTLRTPLNIAMLESIYSQNQRGQKVGDGVEDHQRAGDGECRKRCPPERTAQG